MAGKAGRAFVEKGCAALDIVGAVITGGGQRFGGLRIGGAGQAGCVVNGGLGGFDGQRRRNSGNW